MGPPRIEAGLWVLRFQAGVCAPNRSGNAADEAFALGIAPFWSFWGTMGYTRSYPNPNTPKLILSWISFHLTQIEGNPL